MSSALNTRASRWTTELRATFILAWPLVIAQLAQNALYTTDVIMMGWLGSDYLAAGTLATAFFNPFLLLAGGTVSAVAPLVAQALGGRQIKNVRRTMRQGFWATLIMATLLLPLLWQVRPILIALGQDPLLASMAEEYLHIAMLSLFPGVGIFAMRSFLSALGSTRVLLLVILLGLVVNALGNYALIFGNFGFPRLELRGAAIVTVLTNLLMFCLLLAYVVTHRRYKRFHILARFWKPDWARLREIFRIGLPIGLTILAEVGLFSVASLLMGIIGKNELAAHAVALQLASLAFMVPMGIGMASTVRIGLKFGAGDREGVHIAGWTAFAVGTGFMVMTCLLFVTSAPFLVRLFLDPLDPTNATALALAAVYLGLAGLFQLVDGAQVVMAYNLRGLSDTKIPMFVAFASYWLVGMPVAYVLAFVVGLEGIGVWLGLAAGLAVAATILTARFAMRERLGLLDRLRLISPR